MLNCGDRPNHWECGGHEKEKSFEPQRRTRRRPAGYGGQEGRQGVQRERRVD